MHLWQLRWCSCLPVALAWKKPLIKGVSSHASIYLGLTLLPPVHSTRCQWTKRKQPETLSLAGKAVCGSWLWLATEAILCTLWWLILFWLVFVIFGSCLWYGAAYTVRGVLQVQLQYASTNATDSIQSQLQGMGNTTVPMNVSAPTTAGNPPPPGRFSCPSTCLNLALFDFIVQVRK